MWDYSVFTQCSYYCEWFCLESNLCLCGCRCYEWVRYVDTKQITAWCMSSLILSIYLQLFHYFIMFCFKLTNCEMVKLWVLKWCNGKIKMRIGLSFSQKYHICSFGLFSNTSFLLQTNQSITSKFWSLTTSTETKFILSNQATTEIWGFIRGQTIVVK